MLLHRMGLRNTFRQFTRFNQWRPYRPRAIEIHVCDAVRQEETLGRTFWMCPGLPVGRSGFYIACPRKNCFCMGFGGFKDITTHLREHHSLAGDRMIEGLENPVQIFTFSVEVIRRHEQGNSLAGVQPRNCAYIHTPTQSSSAA
jgi:hypothetical protein